MPEATATLAPADRYTLSAVGWLRTDYPTLSGRIDPATGAPTADATAIYTVVVFAERQALRVTAIIEGADRALAVFYDAAGSRIGAVNPGAAGRTDRYDAVVLTPPAGARSVAITSRSDTPVLVDRLEIVTDLPERVVALEDLPERVEALEELPARVTALEGLPERVEALEELPARVVALEDLPERIETLELLPEQVGTLAAALTDRVAVDAPILAGYIRSYTGELVPREDIKSVIVDVDAGETIYLTTTFAGSELAFVFLDADGAYLSDVNRGIDGRNDAYASFPVTIPEDASAIGVSAFINAVLRVERSGLVTDTAALARQASDALVGFVPAQTTLLPDTYIRHYSGDAIASPDPKYGKNTLSVPVQPGRRYRITSTISGAELAVAVWKRANGTRISSMASGFNGSVTITPGRIFGAPAGAAMLYASGNKNAPLLIEEEVPVPSVGAIATIEPASNGLDNYWQGKTAVWFGSSVPESGYPQLVGEILGMRMFNEALGASQYANGVAELRTADDPYGWTNLPYASVARSFSATLAEKQYLIDNYDYWRPRLLTAPDEINAAEADRIRSYSYETKLRRHLGNQQPNGDGRRNLYVLDAPFNDYRNRFYLNLNGGMNEYNAAVDPVDPYDRGYPVGAVNYIVREILQDDPLATIVFHGHYEDSRNAGVSQAQEVIHKRWRYPLLRSWELMGLSQVPITSGGVTRTLTQWTMDDDLHPYADESGRMMRRLSYIAAHWLRGLR